MEEYVGRTFTVDTKEWGHELEAFGPKDGDAGQIVSISNLGDTFEDTHFDIRLDNGLEIDSISGYHLMI